MLQLILSICEMLGKVSNITNRMVRVKFHSLLVLVLFLTTTRAKATEKRVSFKIDKVCGETSKEPIALTGYQKGDFSVGTQLWTCPDEIKTQAEGTPFHIVGCIRDASSQDLIPLMTDRVPTTPLLKPLGSDRAVYISGQDLLQDFTKKLDSRNCVGFQRILNVQLIEALELGNTTALEMLVKQGAQLESLNKEGHDNLLLASWGGHTETVKYLIEQGANVDSASHSGHTALHAAAQVGSTETIRVLLENGAKINVQAKDGRTAFYLSCLFDHLDTAKLLIKQGADPTIKDKERNSPLHASSERGLLTVMEYLIECLGLDVNDKNAFQSVPLILTSSKGCLDCVKYLVAHGASLQAKDKRGRNSLFMAAAAGHADVVHYLLNSGLTIPDSLDNMGQSPLLMAVISGSLDVVNLLLPLSTAHLNKVSSSGDMTPLKIAASEGNLPIVKVLVEAGADIDLEFPLHSAITNSHTSTSLYFIDQGARIEGDPNKKVLPCLHLAAQSGNTMIIERLIVLGVQVDEISFQKGETPIFFAAKRDHFEVVKALMRNGANPLLKNTEGTSLLFYAIPFPQIVAFLLNRSKLDVNEYSSVFNATPVTFSVEVKAIDTLKYLLTHTKADVNPTKGKSPLIEAAFRDNPAFLQVLLEFGVNVNVTDSSGWTALHIVSSNGLLPHVQILLDHRADVNAKGNDGSTPLLLAAGQGYVDVVHALIERGAEVNSRDKALNTPLYEAARNGHFALVKYLAKRKDYGTDLKLVAEIAKKNGYPDLAEFLLSDPV